MSVTTDNLMADALSHIAVKQQEFFSSNNRYFQGLPTHLIPVIEATPTSPDLITNSPSDFNVKWRTIFPSLPLLLPAQIFIDYYNGPLGKGYIVNLRVRVGTDIRSKTINVGPEIFRAHNWKTVNQ